MKLSLAARFVSFSNLSYLEFNTHFISSRPPSDGLTLDTSLIASNTDLVVSHLKSRKADSKFVDDVMKIKQLRSERNACIMEGDKAKNIRKTLSKDIGAMMKANNIDEVNALKQKVELANVHSNEADEKLAKIDEDIKRIFSVIPNLLDDR
jgi:seryl-tRNA synthetase